MKEVGMERAVVFSQYQFYCRIFSEQLVEREFTAQINHVPWPWLKSTSTFDRDLYQ
jgi:hypothetical protein